MGEPTVLVYGSLENESLVAIHTALAERGRRKAVFVVQEQFPTGLGLYLKMDEPGGVLIPEGQEPIALDDLVSVCSAGYYVANRGIEDFSPEDQSYIQTESWATLIALFRHLSQRCLVANHVVLRDLLANRWAELCFLASHGLPVPRVLVTSDPDQVVEFQARVSELVYKPVGAPGAVFRELGKGDAQRLERIAASPAHFEERPAGEVTRVIVIGNGLELYPAQPVPPSELLEGLLAACRELELNLAECSLRRGEDGSWLASGLSGFVSPEMLSEPEVLGAVAYYLEEGGAP